MIYLTVSQSLNSSRLTTHKDLIVPMGVRELREPSIEYPIPKCPYWLKGLVKEFRKLYPRRSPSFTVIDYDQRVVDVVVHDAIAHQNSMSYQSVNLFDIWLTIIAYVMSYVIQDELGVRYTIRKYFVKEDGAVEWVSKVICPLLPF